MNRQNVGCPVGRRVRRAATHDIPHEFAIYPGHHGSGIAGRRETKTLPLFSKNLAYLRSSAFICSETAFFKPR